MLPNQSFHPGERSMQCLDVPSGSIDFEGDPKPTLISLATTFISTCHITTCHVKTEKLRFLQLTGILKYTYIYIYNIKYNYMCLYIYICIHTSKTSNISLHVHHFRRPKSWAPASKNLDCACDLSIGASDHRGIRWDPT